MNITINENLKTLRREKGNTQQELADHLGMSMQSVSKWECGDGYPDITLIPAIALYYNVTIDKLFGMDEKIIEKQIEDIIFRAEEYCRTGTDTDCEKSISTLREGLKEYPNSYKIMERLMNFLVNRLMVKHGKPTDEALILTNEIIKLGEKILAECTEDRSRLRALHHLCRAYASPEVGMTEKAIELAEKLPPTHVTREGMLADLYEGEKKIKQCRENINLYFNHLIHSMEFYNNIEKDVIITKKIVNLIEIMIEDGNYGYFGFAMSGYYSRIAIDYAKSNDYDKAIENLQLSSENAIRSDTEYKGYSHEYTSLLLRGIKNIFVFIPEGSYSGEALKEMKNSAFDPIRENKAFIEIEEKLKKYAKNK